MGKSMNKSHLTKLVKSARDREKNRIIWQMFFVLELLLADGKNRKLVTAAIAKRCRKVISSCRPSPYRPKGIINSVEQWFNDSVPPQMKGSWIKEIIPEHSIYSKPPNSPNNIDKVPSFFRDQGESKKFPKARLCFFKNARVVNENGVVISYDNRVFADFTFEFGKSIMENYEVFKFYINKPKVRRECLAIITSTGNNCYYHWMFESLPRLKLLAEVVDDIDYLIVPYNLKKFHLETLNLLGFPEEKLLKINDGTHLLCERLFVPSIPRQVPTWACEFVRDSFLPVDVAEPHRLIYISRKDALFRKIINEEEVEDYLRGIGFEIVQMSELSFLDQVKICAEARIVVGPHGAGLSNIVFCQNAKILEIFSPSYVNVCYWDLSNRVGNDYYYFLGGDASENSPLSWSNYNVNMESFKETMESVVRDA